MSVGPVRLSLINIALEVHAEQLYGLCAEHGPILGFE